MFIICANMFTIKSPIALRQNKLNESKPYDLISQLQSHEPMGKTLGII